MERPMGDSVGGTASIPADPEKTSYQKTLAVMKANLSRVIAVTMLLCSVILLFLMLGILVSAAAQPFSWWQAAGDEVLAAAGLLALFFVLLPLELGIKRWFYLLCFDEDQPVSSIFFFFQGLSRYGKAVRFRFQMTVRRLGVYLLYLLPAALLELCTWGVSQYGEGWRTAFGALTSAALALGLVFGFLRNLKFFLADYLLFCDLSCSGKKAANISVGLMKTRSRELTGTFLSLFPFYLVSLFVVPLLLLIPVLYVLTAVKGIEFLKQDQKGKNMFSGVWYSGGKDV